jgi:hypothetical protein
VVENCEIQYRKIKSEFLIETSGIFRSENHINRASPERAFLDMLYLDKDAYFDNLNPLKKDLVYKILPIYQSRALTKRVSKILPHG